MAHNNNVHAEPHQDQVLQQETHFSSPLSPPSSSSNIRHPRQWHSQHDIDRVEHHTAHLPIESNNHLWQRKPLLAETVVVPRPAPRSPCSSSPVFRESVSGDPYFYRPHQIRYPSSSDSPSVFLPVSNRSATTTRTSLRPPDHVLSDLDQARRQAEACSQQLSRVAYEDEIDAQQRERELAALWTERERLLCQKRELAERERAILAREKKAEEMLLTAQKEADRSMSVQQLRDSVAEILKAELRPKIEEETRSRIEKEVRLDLEAAKAQSSRAASDSQEIWDRLMDGIDEDLVSKHLSKPKSPATVITAFNVDLTQDDVLTMRDREWVGSEVINVYMKILAKSAGAQGYSPRCHFMNTHFMAKLQFDTGVYCYDDVKRWTRRVDIFSFDKVIVPVNASNVHWYLVVADMKARRLDVIDSMGGSVAPLKVMLRYLQDEKKDKKKTALEDDWSLNIRTDNPHQSNHVDCGVFTCMYALCEAKGLPFLFKQASISKCRRKMVSDILSFRE